MKSGGAKRDRTADLYNAIVALSQLSYGPMGCLALPKAGRVEKLRSPAGRFKRKTPVSPALGLFVLDLLDDLGHVAVVLAELGGVLD